MKRVIPFCLAALLCFGLLAGCGTQESSSAADSNSSESSEAPTPSAQSQEESGSDSPESSDVGDESPEAADDATGAAPTVYMTTDITPEGLIAVYEALGAAPSGNIAVKLSTGEPGSNYLRPELIGSLVQSFENPTIVECNTAYGGQRANTAMHYQVAEDHGYTALCDVDIMDENGSMTLPVTGGSNLAENYVGANFANYDIMSSSPTSRATPWRGTAGPLKTSPSASPPPRARPTSTPAAPGAACGAATRTLFWKAWPRRANPWWMR